MQIIYFLVLWDYLDLINRASLKPVLGACSGYLMMCFLPPEDLPSEFYIFTLDLSWIY